LAWSLQGGRRPITSRSRPAAFERKNRRGATNDESRARDVAVIVHTHEPNYAYEVECSDTSDGETLWLDAMYGDELAAFPE